jgi:hypothetical protein
MKLRLSHWGVLAVLVPLGLLALLRAQENERSTSPPASVAVPEKPPQAPDADTAEGEDTGDVLPPGERLSADNNLSWPVDI